MKRDESAASVVPQLMSENGFAGLNQPGENKINRIDESIVIPLSRRHKHTVRRRILINRAQVLR